MNRADEWADKWADYLDPFVADPDLPPTQRASLDRLAATLADVALWSEPPASLRDTLLQRAAAETHARAPAGAPPLRPRDPPWGG